MQQVEVTYKLEEHVNYFPKYACNLQKSKEALQLDGTSCVDAQKNAVRPRATTTQKLRTK